MLEQLVTKRSIRNWLLIACTAASGFTSTLCSTVALSQAGQGKATATDDLRPVYANAQDIAEGKRVAEAAGVELLEDPWEMNVLATQRGSRHYPSMLEDVEARRPTEVELINGSLVREAARHGVEIPLQTALYRLVKAKEASYA